MSNVGLTIVGWSMMVLAVVASYWNSFLIMNLINATPFMWSLWWGSLILMVFGSVVSGLSK
jgi:hypothetical protein